MKRLSGYLDTGFFHPILNHQEDGEHDASTIIDEKVKPPRRYKVLLHNDDYTTMEFVILVLKTVFGKSEVESQVLMLKVHTEGTAVCGVYSFEIAETKVAKVTQMARESGHPLRCTFEPE